MEIINFDLETKLSHDNKRVIAIGKFQSLHLGHQEVLSRAYRLAKATKKKLIILAYPDFNGFKQLEESNIYNQTIRTRMFKQYSPEYLIWFEPNVKNYAVTKEVFEKYLKECLNVDSIIVGEDYKIKEDSYFDYITTKFDVEKIPLVKVNNQKISSTLIQLMFDTGEIENVNKLLGHEYFIEGVVKQGNKFGQKLGAPTVNIDWPKNNCIPKHGIYFSKVIIEGKKYHSISSISTNPTVSNTPDIKFETHILNFDLDLYGKTVFIQLLKFYREPIKFDDVESLRDKIKDDIKIAENFFKKW